MKSDNRRFMENAVRLQEMAEAVGGAKLILDDVVGELGATPAAEGARAKIVAVSMSLSMVAGGLEAMQDEFCRER